MLYTVWQFIITAHNVLITFCGWFYI